MSRRFPNTPTFHPATAPHTPDTNHPASPRSAPGRRRAQTAGHGAEHVRALRAAPDRDLVAAITAGDDDALCELITRHRRPLWLIAYRYVRRDHVAHDVVATVLDLVWRKADQYRGSAPVEAWLARITANAAVDLLRHERAHPGGPDPVAPTEEYLSVHALARVGDVAGDVADRDLVARLLAELPAEQRRAVELVDADGHSVTDAAAALGCAEGTVKSRRARAFRALAAHWTPDGDPRRR